MSENSNGKRKMSTAVNWSQMIGAIAGPMQPGDTRESWIARAARKAGITYRQAKSLCYGETTDPKFSVAKSVLSAAEQAREEQRRRENIMLASRFETLAGGLNARDEDFNREDISSLLHAADLLRKMDCA